jgi:hypothetical protein
MPLRSGRHGPGPHSGPGMNRGIRVTRLGE